MFSKITKLNDYDKVTLIYEPTVQAKQQKSRVLTYLIILISIAIFLLGVNFAFHFMRYTSLIPPSPNKPNSNDVNGSINASNGFHTCPQANFDYLLLSIRWPPSFCNYQNCKKGAKMYDWGIHGLWPDFRNGSYPSFCCDDFKFDLKPLEPILPQLELHWKDLTNDDSEHALWIHEWSKHGTCTVGNPKLGTVFNYFNATLDLFNKYQVQTWLEAEDILPTPSKPYKLASIVNAIESRLGKRIRVECDKYTHEKENCDKADYSNGKPENCRKVKSKTFKLLDSIDLCFDKALNPVDCPQVKAYRKQSCDNEVYYFRLKEDLDSLKF